jgi:4-amino-4-deoxy-L-arabinose transferase-like glycosyltransferase
MHDRLTSFFSKYEFVLPLIIFVFFLCASLPGISWGAPALWNPDEVVWRVSSALRGELIFDETEPDFNYPSLPKYVMYAIGLITYSLGKSDFAFIVAARTFSAMLGAISGIFIYYFARSIGISKKISFLAGILYVVSGAAVENGRYAHNDLYLQLFIILCVFFITKYQYTKSVAWLYASFFAAGLAASSKYTGGSLALLPAFILISSNWSELRSRWLFVIRNLVLGGVFSFLGYGFGTPKALLAPIYYFSNVIPALQNYPQYGFNSGSPIGLLGQWSIFELAVGIFAYYLFLFSFVWFVIRLITWKLGKTFMEQKQVQAISILILAVLIFDLPFLVSINYIPRYFIPFVPFLSILAALMIEEISSLAKHSKISFVQPILVSIFVIGISYSILRLVSISLLFINDSRIPATEYIATIRGYQKSIEYTLYPPHIEKSRFERAHNYPIYFVKYPDDIVPTGGRYEYNLGEQGLLQRDTDYFVIDSYTYNRFYTDSVCVTNPVECDFFKRLLKGEIESYRLIKVFTYSLPPYLPTVFARGVNPEIRIYERVR